MKFHTQSVSHLDKFHVQNLLRVHSCHYNTTITRSLVGTEQIGLHHSMNVGDSTFVVSLQSRRVLNVLFGVRQVSILVLTLFLMYTAD